MISVKINIEYDSYVKGYYLFLIFNNGDITTSDKEIIKYFNLKVNIFNPYLYFLLTYFLKHHPFEQFLKL